MLDGFGQVENWGKVSVPLQYEKHVEKHLESLLERSKRIEQDWRMIYSKGDIKVFCRNENTGLQELSCYAAATMDCSAEVALDVLNDEEVLRKCDPNIDTLKVLSQDHHNRFMHIVMKGMFWSAPREVVTLDHWRVDPSSGIIYRAVISVDHDEVPEHEDPNVRVRALIKSWAMLIPHQDDPGKTTLKFKLDIDARLEYIPAWILKIASGTAQKVNSREFANNIERLKQISKTEQAKRIKNHIVTNEGGSVARRNSQTSVVQASVDDAVKEWMSVRFADILIPFFIILSYSVATVLPSEFIPA